MFLSPASRSLILMFEGISTHPNWPGGGSGVTLGVGCDIGTDPDSLDAWTHRLDPAAMARLEAARGVTGTQAGVAARSLSDILITVDTATAVFDSYSTPRAIADTLRAFPGADRLPADSFGALVSLVYNRGAAVQGPSRAEMLNIRILVASDHNYWGGIPIEIADMTRLWGAPSASNLSGRRLREAALVASGLRGKGTTLLFGDTGDAIASLQRALQLSADGAFGSQTMLEVWKWQHSQGLPSTGIADVGTLKSLGL